MRSLSIESAEDALFKQIIANPYHVLAYPLPDKTDVYYYFRPRLLRTTNSNFIVLML